MLGVVASGGQNSLEFLDIGELKLVAKREGQTHGSYIPFGCLVLEGLGGV